MNKPSLETQVRKALIEQKTDELVEYASKNPEYKSRVIEFLDSATESLFDKDEDQEMREEYKKEVLDGIRAQLDNIEQLRKAMYEEAKREYMSVRQFKTKLKTHLEDIKKDEELSGVVDRYEKAFEELSETVRTNDKIVRKLTKIAETKGLEKAVQKETRYAVIREMFPTAEDYRTFVIKGLEAVKKFSQKAQSALMSDGEAGQLMAGMLGKITIKFLELVEKVKEDYMGKTIKEIYG